MANEWNASYPLDHTLISDVPGEIRKLKTSAKTQFDMEHETPVDGDATGSEHSNGSGVAYEGTDTPANRPDGTTALADNAIDRGRLWLDGCLKRWNGSAWAGAVNIAYFQTGAKSTAGSTQIPADDTIPQITEGNLCMTLAFTPISATNKLKIEIVIHISHAGAASFLDVALFADAGPSAIAAARGGRDAGTNATTCVTFTHWMTAGTTSEISFTVRAGSNAVGALTFNGAGGNRILGGVIASSITITEIAG